MFSSKKHVFGSSIVALGTLFAAEAARADTLCDLVKEFQREQAATGARLDASAFSSWAGRLQTAIGQSPESPCIADARMQASMAFSMSPDDEASLESALAVAEAGLTETSDVATLARLGNQAVSMAAMLEQLQLTRGVASPLRARSVRLSAAVCTQLPAWPVLIARAQAGQLTWDTFDLIIPLRAHAVHAGTTTSENRESGLTLLQDLNELSTAAKVAGVTIETETTVQSVRAGIVLAGLRDVDLTLDALRNLTEQLGSTSADRELDELIAGHPSNTGLDHETALRRLSEAVRVTGASDLRVDAMLWRLVQARSAKQQRTTDEANLESVTEAELASWEDIALDGARALADAPPTDATPSAEVLARRSEHFKTLLGMRWQSSGHSKAIAQEYARRFPTGSHELMLRQAAR
jgi:hypothetical protein